MQKIKYTVKCDSRSDIANAFAVQLSEGRAGEVLIRDGFSQGNFVRFLARFAMRAIKAGYDEDKLVEALGLVAAGNASQAKTACKDISVRFEGKDKDVSLGDLWSSANGAAKPDVSIANL